MVVFKEKMDQFIIPDHINQANEIAKALSPLLRTPQWMKWATIVGAVAAVIAAVASVAGLFR